jgi:hypothetical protein
MKELYTSIRQDSEFTIYDVDGEIYAVDEDRVMGGFGKYHITRPCKFVAGSNEFISVTQDGEVERIYDVDLDDCVIFGDFEFDDDAQCFEDLF